MSSLSIQDIVRSANVTRWQIVKTLRQQNLAEHQYMVTMISVEIAKRLMGNEFRETDELHLMKYTMMHDAPELAMGDICTPVKQRIKATCGFDVFDEIEQEICEECHTRKLKIKGTIFESIAKLADLIDGINFLEIEGHGKHSSMVLDKLKSVLLEHVKSCNDNYGGYPWGEVQHLISELFNDDISFLKFENALK